MFSNPTTLRIIAKALMDCADALPEQGVLTSGEPLHLAPPQTLGQDLRAFTQEQLDEIKAQPSKSLGAIPPPPGGVEFDLDGRPWDERIDSGAHTKTVDGRWKLLKGVDKALAERVKAEYRQAILADVSASAAKDPLVTGTVPPPPADVCPVDFAGFIRFMNDGMKEGKFTMARVKEVCDTLQLPGYTALAAQPALIQPVFDLLCLRG